MSFEFKSKVESFKLISLVKDTAWLMSSYEASLNLYHVEGGGEIIVV